MKKIITGIAVLISIIFIFESCTDKPSEINEIGISQKLSTIEKNIENNNIDIPKYISPYDLNNKNFFKDISKILSKYKSENKYLSKNDLNKLINKTLENYTNSLNEDVNLKSERKLTQKEKLIFKSYFKELSNSNLSKIKITNYYLSNIASLNLSVKNMQFTMNTFSFIRQLMISINYDKNVNVNQSIEDFDACFDACMNAKARAVFDGNWIDKAEFILSAAETTAWWICSCGWNCA